MIRSTMVFGALLAASGVLAAVGCANKAKCDPGQDLDRGSCVAEETDAGTGGATGTGGTPAEGGNGGQGGSASGGSDAVGFGTPCTQEENPCMEPAPDCAALPGEVGVCSKLGCQADASICPEGWSCQVPVPTYDICLPNE
jgi:hypothetical protein